MIKQLASQLKTQSKLLKFNFSWQQAFMKQLVIPKGDQYAVLNKSGEINILEGPKRKLLLNCEYQKMVKHTANDKQFIMILKENGQMQIIQGPNTFFQHPIDHLQVQVEDAWDAQKGQTLQVLVHESENKNHYKYIKGPVYYQPNANEQLVAVLHEVVAQKNQYVKVSFKDGNQEILEGPVSITQDPTIHETVEVFNIKNILANQGLLIYKENKQGQIEPEFIYGPGQYIPKPHEWIEQRISLQIANPNEYMKITYKDGSVKTFPGPHQVWEDPINQKQVEIGDFTLINSCEAIVVYGENEGKLQRKIIEGPNQYFPQGKEWIHQFSWHGAVYEGDREYKRPGALKFTKLKLMPLSFYHDVDNVRTQDDAPITIKLMVFYKLVDVNKMLDSTYDPIGEFINGVSADVIEEVGRHNFENFKKNIENLNKIETYKYLTKKGSEIGYEITKIVCKGYVSTPTLEQMHYSAIEKRTQLVLDTETEEQEQKLKDFILSKNKERVKEESQLEKQKLENEIEIQNIRQQNQVQTKEQEFQLEMEQQQLVNKNMNMQQEEQNKLQNQLQQEIDQQEIEKEKKIQQIKIETAQKVSEIEIQKLEKIKQLGGDISSYLVAKEQGRPDKWLQIDSPNDKQQQQVHFHEKV